MSKMEVMRSIGSKATLTSVILASGLWGANGSHDEPEARDDTSDLIIGLSVMWFIISAFMTLASLRFFVWPHPRYEEMTTRQKALAIVATTIINYSAWPLTIIPLFVYIYKTPERHRAAELPAGGDRDGGLPAIEL